MKSSNKEIDIFMATKVMRWVIGWGTYDREYYEKLPNGEPDYDYGLVCPVLEYNPSTDLNKAMECVEEVQRGNPHPDGGSWVRWELTMPTRSETISFRISNLGNRYERGYSCDKYPAMAVCLALKEFVESRSCGG